VRRYAFNHLLLFSGLVIDENVGGDAVGDQEGVFDEPTEEEEPEKTGKLRYD
jgi:hypothetical protein